MNEKIKYVSGISISCDTVCFLIEKKKVMDLACYVNEKLLLYFRILSKYKHNYQLWIYATFSQILYKEKKSTSSSIPTEGFLGLIKNYFHWHDYFSNFVYLIDCVQEEMKWS